MKLLLANGSEYTLTSMPERGSSLVNGAYIDSVKFFIAGDLATIKSEFQNQEYLSLLTVINDDKSSGGEYSGYQKLVSIGYSQEASTDEQDVFTVTLALTNDVQALIKVWNESLTKTTEKADNAVSTASAANASAENANAQVAQLVVNTDIDKMTVAEAKAFKISQSKQALSDYLATHPISSSCHGGVEATYSIVSDKQQYLISMIAVAQMAQAAGVDYKPSWNATGEECTYDWTADELQQLAFEMETVVRPLVSKQQAIETEINACKTLAKIKAVEISY